MIQFEHIQINYDDFIAVKDLNLNINKGEFFTLLGPSGCGKTTILRSLVGFLTPKKGKIIVGGEDYTKKTVEDREIGIVFQSYALFPTMNVFENIAFGLRVKKIDDETIKEKVYEIIHKIELDERHLYKNVAELSGGQQQRVALARAVILEPTILCLDEPLSNLDASLRKSLRGELKRLQRDLGITTVYVTHDQEEALTLSDRIAVFDHGEIEQVGTPFEVYNESASKFVCEFIGDINRLEIDILKDINRNCNVDFNTETEAFIRIERLQSVSDKKLFTFNATITNVEYVGQLTTYTLECYNQELKYIDKNTTNKQLNVNDKITLQIDPEDIMQFEVEE